MNLPARLGGGRSLLAVLCLSGCATMGAPSVGPGDIPSLQARVAREPEDGTLKLQLAAALASADRCGEAVEIAREGRILRPSDPAGPLIVGRCLERAGNLEGALQVYARYLESYGNAGGADVVRGRRLLTFQTHAREEAQRALAREEELAPGDPETVGVFPFLVDGGPRHQPLSAGLAHMLTTDLALLGRFSMVERVETNALLEELELPRELVDPATAARAGRILQASRMVLGTVRIPSEDEAALGGNIVLETGELVQPLSLEGDLANLLDLEKSFALQLAEDLGYQVSEAERQRILENRPGSLAAFLAFSRGLLEEDLGNFESAAALYREAVQLDPSYGQARSRLDGVSGAQVVVGTEFGQLPFLRGGAEAARVGAGLHLLAGALGSSLLDLASHQSERATLNVGTVNPLIETVLEEALVLPLLEAVILVTITIPR